jgi:ubiquitin-protein ligase
MERWRPVYGVIDILNAVMVMLDKPNPDSPENVDAGVSSFQLTFSR